jgi:predicted Zn-dependent protease
MREVRDLLRSTVRENVGDARELHVERFREGVTRFANSEIHQNVEEDNVVVRAIVTRGRRVGVASGNRVEAVGRTLRQAAEIAEISPEIPDFAGFASPAPCKGADPYDEGMLSFDPAARAQAVGRAVEIADRSKLVSCGFASQTLHELAIVNSNGVDLASRSARGGFLFLPYDERGSGYAELAFGLMKELEVEGLASEACDRARRSRDPIELAPGVYPVVLDTWAVADLLAFVGYMGLNALALEEKRSFLDGRLGEKVFSERLTIVDGPFSRENPGYPFDWEGSPKAPLTVMEKGVFASPVFDRRTAAKQKRASTGHGLPPPNPWGPMPMNLVVRPGAATLDELVAGVKRGVFVTRFHYTNVVDPRKGIITGMTRDGTFLIEDGRIGPGIKNLRFTQGLAEAFASVSAVSSRALLSGEYLRVYAPAMRLETFTFTSATRF